MWNSTIPWAPQLVPAPGSASLCLITASLTPTPQDHHEAGYKIHGQWFRICTGTSSDSGASACAAGKGNSGYASSHPDLDPPVLDLDQIPGADRAGRDVDCLCAMSTAVASQGSAYADHAGPGPDVVLRGETPWESEAFLSVGYVALALWLTLQRMSWRGCAGD